jgi:hypothetical protein
MLFALVAAGAACSKKPAPSSPSDPAFDKQWAQLAQQGVEVSYIEDDRGEGLMGNVRRASRVKAEPPSVAPSGAVAANPGALPEQPPFDQVQQIIRGNLMAVRGRAQGRPSRARPLSASPLAPTASRLGCASTRHRSTARHCQAA